MRIDNTLAKTFLANSEELVEFLRVNSQINIDKNAQLLNWAETIVHFAEAIEVNKAWNIVGVDNLPEDEIIEVIGTNKSGEQYFLFAYLTKEGDTQVVYYFDEFFDVKYCRNNLRPDLLDDFLTEYIGDYWRKVESPFDKVE